MTFFGSLRKICPAALAASASLILMAASASAQQITYYDFDAPQANPGQYSFNCAAVAKPSALFCLNDGGNNVLPTFLSDTYPASIDPNPADNPAQSSTHYAAQMTQTGSQQSSMWFSLPQKVASGFTAWFAFKLTPDPASGTTADGLAFVIQNASGPGSDTSSGCNSTGSRFSALGGGGGCMGYGGIPNSLALEFDTYQNSYDNDNNHMALQNCGAGLPNSPDHAMCNVVLDDEAAYAHNPLTSAADPSAQTPVTLADGNVHQVVVVYSGPQESSQNLLQVYLDPTFVAGTHTPVPGSIPVFQGTYDLATALNLLNTGGGANDSAYIGFTAGTGSYFENGELMAWTFTPHTTVTQQQPLNSPGTPTTYDFGTHSYAVNLPSGTTTSNISMGVIATTITQAQFASLLQLGPTQYAGSQCQVYDDTGGNCIIYSTYCFYTDTKTPTACPAPPSPVDCAGPNASGCIDLTSSYNNSIQPTSPGYLQGDPLFSPIQSIVSDGTTATVTCVGECPVTVGQTVTILDNNDTAQATATVQSVPAVNQFTFASSLNQTGGFLTSNNVQDIFTQYYEDTLDGSTTAQSKNWSDFVVTAVTNTGGSMNLTAPNNDVATQGQADVLTATVTPPSPTVQENANPSNLLTLLPTGSPGLTLSGTVTFYVGTDTTVPPISGCTAVQLNAAYQATCSYTPSSTGPVTITAVYSGDAYHNLGPSSVGLTVNPPSTVNISPSSINLGTLYLGQIVTKIVTLTNIGTGPLSISDPRIAIVGGGDSSEFITLNLCPRSLAAGKSCIMTVTFIAGPFYTQQTAALTISDSSPNSPQTVPLTATVINPRVRLSTGALNFGAQTVNTSTTVPLTITNVGTTNLSITGVSVGGADPLDFAAPNTCTAPVPTGTSCTLQVTFTPQAKKGRSAVLVIQDNAQNSPQGVSLSGTGK